MGGNAPELTDEIVENLERRWKSIILANPHPALPQRGREDCSDPLFFQRGGRGVFVVHCPYFVNFGSKEPRIYYGSISVVAEELKRAICSARNML